MNLLRSKLSQFQHLSDEVLSSLISGELTTVQGFRARSHIEKCWQCRSRREAFEKAAMQITEHRNRITARIPTNSDRRANLIADLRKRTEYVAPQPVWTRSILNFRTRIGGVMTPIFASTAIVVAATFLLVWVWQRSLSPVNAAQLLQMAQASDTAVSQQKPGVVYQKVRITSPLINVEHELYRDPRGVRRPRAQTAKTESEPAQHMLSAVGVEWNAPLSAASYQEWHDQQVSVTDQVYKEEGDLLRLVSKSPNNWIQQESLTVRASDFHPVERTIETRSYGTIEIAELSYVVLPWSGVNEALFEPLAGPIPTPAHETPLILSTLPSMAQLDSAELSARLTLNRLHADEGEQINVFRTDRDVEVKGVVETDARKHKLISELHVLPHVNAEILSIPELQAAPENRSTAQSVTMQSIDVQSSPLEKYLAAQPAGKTELSTASQRLLNAALKVRQSAGQLTAIERRFTVSGESDPNGSAATQLAQSYVQRLASSLDDEAATLRTLGFEQPPQLQADTDQIDLLSEVDRNEALCRELIVGNTGPARAAAEIAPEIYESTTRIRSAIASLPRSSK